MTFIITDDDADDRDFMADALISAGFKGTIKFFENGQLLLSYLPKFDASAIILLDLNMPVLNGYDTLKAIKSNRAYDNLPVIILSSSTKKEDELLCMKMGCSEFIQKPLMMNEYLNIANHLLERK